MMFVPGCCKSEPVPGGESERRVRNSDCGGRVVSSRVELDVLWQGEGKRGCCKMVGPRTTRSDEHDSACLRFQIAAVSIQTSVKESNCWWCRVCVIEREGVRSSPFSSSSPPLLSPVVFDEAV